MRVIFYGPPLYIAYYEVGLYLMTYYHSGQCQRKKIVIMGISLCNAIYELSRTWAEPGEISSDAERMNRFEIAGGPVPLCLPVQHVVQLDLALLQWTPDERKTFSWSLQHRAQTRNVVPGYFWTCYYIFIRKFEVFSMIISITWL